MLKTTDLREIQKMVLAKPEKDGARSPLFFVDRGDDHRQIVLEVNSQEPITLVLCYPDNTTQFLKVVEGRERVTFGLRGAAELWASDPTDPNMQLWWWCSEMEQMDTAIAVPHTFTVIRERRQRNTDLDKMMRLANYNAQLRENRIMAEFRAIKSSMRKGDAKPEKVSKLTAQQKEEAEAEIQREADEAAQAAVEAAEAKKAKK